MPYSRFKDNPGLCDLKINEILEYPSIESNQKIEECVGLRVKPNIGQAYFIAKNHGYTLSYMWNSSAFPWFVFCFFAFCFSVLFLVKIYCTELFFAQFRM